MDVQTVKKNNFNILRIILATMVIFSHSYELLGMTAPLICLRSMGNFAVHCFFVISGYLITLSFLREPELLKFGTKRIARLLPAFLVAYFFSSYIGNLCGNFVNNPIPYIINGSIWTLSYEIGCYVIVAILGIVGLLNKEVIGSLFISGMLFIIININSTSLAYTVIVPMLFCFLGGMYIALAEIRLNMKILGICSLILIVVINFFPNFFYGLIGKLPWIYGPTFEGASINYFIYLVALPFLVIYFAKYFPKIVTIRSDISYGLYIYAWPIQQMLIFIMLKNSIECTPFRVFIFSLLLTCIASLISWNILENPIMRLKDYLLYRWNQRDNQKT